MGAPEGILCTKTHEYVYEKDGSYLVGITDYAVEQLGDIVFVELPEVGTELEKKEVFATIESVKAASEVYMPVSGKIVEINERLLNEPELINSDCYEEGWLIKVEPSSLESDLEDAMEYEDYISDVEE
ncbi:MAG TPA: glycine cleavage system protein GcvH [Candidatus Adamsella sp.]|nr:glycine cleavage system protein GcvH [Candidatus Adamsella sp.]